MTHKSNGMQSLTSPIRAIATTLILFLGSLSAFAQPYNVTITADSGSGSLRDAIINANGNAGADVINVLTAGTVALSSALPEITDDLIINGNGLTIDGGNTLRAILINSSITVEINDLTFINCDADKGGAIRNNNGNPDLTINDCHFMSNNASDEGGAIFNKGHININRSTFVENTAANDGGAILDKGTMTVTETLLDDNAASRGGGLRAEGGQSNWTESAIINNEATTGGDQTGGGISVGSGGGANGSVTFTNSTISGNMAEQGGGVRLENGAGTFNNVTITNNTATDLGGGIVLNTPDASVLTLSLTIVAGNMAPEGPDIYSWDPKAPVSNGYNLIGNDDESNFSASTGDIVGNNNAPIDPMLGPLTDNGGPTPTHALLPGSPAIDQGGSCQTFDQRGLNRNDGICDIGAFEEGAVPFPIPTLGQWGLIILAMAMMIIGTVAYRRKERSLLSSSNL